MSRKYTCWMPGTKYADLLRLSSPVIGKEKKKISTLPTVRWISNTFSMMITNMGFKYKDFLAGVSLAVCAACCEQLVSPGRRHKRWWHCRIRSVALKGKNERTPNKCMQRTCCTKHIWLSSIEGPYAAQRPFVFLWLQVSHSTRYSCRTFVDSITSVTRRTTAVKTQVSETDRG